jgi:hypothetical protein
VLLVPAWQKIPGLVHAFCGRRGGVSTGVFADFNLSRHVGDDPYCVDENWRLLQNAVDGRLQAFATVRQVHGTRVVAVREPAEPVEADGLASTTAGIGLCILTADCVPLLIVAPSRGVVAALHAGWRGTVAGIATRAVEMLQQQWQVEPEELSVALGPSIGGCCYEVEEQIGTDLEKRCGPLPEGTLRPSDGATPRLRLDLRAANAHLLRRSGVNGDKIFSVGPCTRCHAEAYFSYRASAAAGGDGITGRQVSFVGWAGQLGTPPPVW